MPGILRIALVLTVVSLSAGPASGVAAANTILVDGSDVADDADGCGGGAGAVSDPCNTIQAGVAAASAGDTVRVAAGGYAGPITISKPSLRLIGPQSGTAGYDRPYSPTTTTEAVVDCPVGGNSTCVETAAEDVTVAGLALTDPDGGTMLHVGAPGATLRDDLVGPGNPAVVVEADGAVVVSNAFYGSLSGDRVFGGVWSRVPVADLVVGSNLFDSMMGPAVLVDGASQGVSVVDNAALNGGDLGGGSLTVGNATDVELSGNVVEQSFYGLLVFGIHHGTIADNVVTGASTGLTVRPSFAEPPERSGDLLIDGNDLSGNGWIREAGTFGEIKIAPGALDGPVTVARNRIAGSPVDTDSYGLYNGDASHTVEAVDNWWGCNEGPSGARCDPVAGAVDVPSWLVLGLAASNASPGGPGAVEITARLGRNSDGLPVDGLPDVPVSFRDGSGPGAFVDPPTLLTAGEAHATFVSDEFGQAWAAAIVDREIVNLAMDFGKNPNPPPSSRPPVPGSIIPRLPALPAPSAGPSTAVIQATLRATVDRIAKDLRTLTFRTLRHRGGFAVPTIVVPATGRLVAELRLKSHGSTVKLARGTGIVQAGSELHLTAKTTRRGRTFMRRASRPVTATLFLGLEMAGGTTVHESSPVRMRAAASPRRGPHAG
ncbi:MAG: hypothetical protein E6G10_19105 [Actinobacteria bacterium]|nr:MAG: hypothetical protein E6G10_19105 [Actinomycetota bacterium]